MGIILQNVGIFEEKFGGDEWGFLITEVGILTQKILATLSRFHTELGIDKI